MKPQAFFGPDTDGRRVAQTTLRDGRWISTVLLVVSHAEPGGGYETMVFPSKEYLLETYCERYRTRADAERGHRRIVAAARRGKYKKANALA